MTSQLLLATETKLFLQLKFYYFVTPLLETIVIIKMLEVFRMSQVIAP